jgi:hypothetical protein
MLLEDETLEEITELRTSEEFSLDSLVSEFNEDDETESDIETELINELLIDETPASPQATITRVDKKIECKFFFLIKISFYS